MGLIQTAGQNSDGSVAISVEGRSTYRYVVAGVGIAASPSDVLVIQGSATKTVKVKRICLTCGCLTTSALRPVSLMRRSSANTFGSPTTRVGYPHDPLSPAATAVVVQDDGTPGALGTLVGLLAATRVLFQLYPTAPVPGGPAVFDFSNRWNMPLVLRGVSDFVALNFGGIGTPGGSPYMDVVVETEEDNS